MSEIILDSVIDSIKLLPFLFLTYLFMEWLEHKTGVAARKRIRTAGKFGPVWGGLLGVIPQCGFSAAASSLFAGRVITVGTLIAVYLSTSDEMFPIMISNAVPVVTIVKILTYYYHQNQHNDPENFACLAALFLLTFCCLFSGAVCTGSLCAVRLT